MKHFNYHAKHFATIGNFVIKFCCIVLPGRGQFHLICLRTQWQGQLQGQRKEDGRNRGQGH